MKTPTLFASLALAGATFVASSAQAWWGPWNNHNDRGRWGGGNDWGPMDAIMDGDFDFNMSFHSRARGYGRGHGYGYGQGYGRPYYGYPNFAPVAYVPAPAPAPAVIEPPVVFDSDHDSVTDAQDLCPNTPAGTRVDFTGCAKDQPITLRGVNFKLDSAELTPESSSILDVVAGTLSSHPEVTVEVGGHTDSQGDAAYNLDLSARRASTVRDYLITHGVPAANLTSSGYGETRMIDNRETAAAHATNRRVELTRTDTATTRVTQQ
jgi:outer membrane protein OmpA-like peptidoglycan-associated protein